MNRVTYRTAFSASHRSEETDCWPGIDHGHDWCVDVSAEGPTDPRTGMVRGTEELHGDIRSLMVEIDGKPVNTSIPATNGSLQSVAMWVLERLQAKCPQVVEVSVSIGDHAKTATYRREVR